VVRVAENELLAESQSSKRISHGVLLTGRHAYRLKTPMRASPESACTREDHRLGSFDVPSETSES
jgi:hypothetical protein